MMEYSEQYPISNPRLNPDLQSQIKTYERPVSNNYMLTEYMYSMRTLQNLYHREISRLTIYDDFNRTQHMLLERQNHEMLQELKKKYYKNKLKIATGLWRQPNIYKAIPLHMHLPPGFECHADKSGRIFYVTIDHKTASWNHPIIDSMVISEVEEFVKYYKASNNG